MKPRAWMPLIPNPTWRWPESCTKWDGSQRRKRKYKFTCAFTLTRLLRLDASTRSIPQRAGWLLLRGTKNRHPAERSPAGWR